MKFCQHGRSTRSFYFIHTSTPEDGGPKSVRTEGIQAQGEELPTTTRCDLRWTGECREEILTVLTDTKSYQMGMRVQARLSIVVSRRAEYYTITEAAPVPTIGVYCCMFGGGHVRKYLRPQPLHIRDVPESHRFSINASYAPFALDLQYRSAWWEI